MANEKIDIEKITNHWEKTADRDFETMIHLYEKKDLHWSLFLGHLVLERLLKAAVVRNIQNHAPYTHDLRRLAKLTQFEFNDEYKMWLDTITTFNINARYDTYKQDFYKKCTPQFTERWIAKIKELRKWIKQQL